MLDYQKLLRFSCCRRMPHFEPHGLGFRACLVGSLGFTWTPKHVKNMALLMILGVSGHCFIGFRGPGRGSIKGQALGLIAGLRQRSGISSNP